MRHIPRKKQKQNEQIEELSLTGLNSSSRGSMHPNRSAFQPMNRNSLPWTAVEDRSLAHLSPARSLNSSFLLERTRRRTLFVRRRSTSRLPTPLPRISFRQRVEDEEASAERLWLALAERCTGRSRFALVCASRAAPGRPLKLVSSPLWRDCTGSRRRHTSSVSPSSSLTPMRLCLSLPRCSRPHLLPFRSREN
jgi:hypothetical protein